MKILKYKLLSQNGEEFEFETTRIVETTTTIKTSKRTDEFGNIISAREGIKSDVKQDVKEGISAISLPSRTPAIVEIIETDAELVSSNQIESERSNPVKIKTNPGERSPVIDLNKALYPEEGRIKPLSLPKAGEITWA
jgi:hypothetical protein